MAENIVVLDATLRDGGYYPNWEFSPDLVNEYLRVCEKAKINAIELGFRSPNVKGPFSNITDDFIMKNLYVPGPSVILGVMINTSEFTSDMINKFFMKSSLCFIKLVRLATHFKDIDKAESICKDLKRLGYIVSINLMQAADKSFDEIKFGAEKIEKWKTVDILYLADSLGGMNSDSVDYAFKAIKEGWNGLTGFHAHNNKNQALSNTLEAVDIGVDWVDSTFLSMGRGPGNCETEYLLLELNKRGYGEFDVEQIYKLVLHDFQLLKNKYKWGSSLLYYLAAEYNIHPTYIQTMLSRNYSVDIILKAVDFLKNNKSNSFKESILLESIGKKDAKI